MDKIFWQEPVATAAYLINRTTTSILPDDVVPAQIWFGQKPELSKIKIFGCLSYVHIPAENRHNKFDKRSQKMYLIGYTNNGYHLWNPQEERILVARNVIFDETKMFGTRKQQEKVTIHDDDVTDVEDNDSESINSNQEDPVENYEDIVNKSERPRRTMQVPKHFEDYDLNYDNSSDSYDEGMIALFIESIPLHKTSRMPCHKVGKKLYKMN